MQQATQTTKNNSYSQPLLDKAFFGKDNCLTVQLRDGACYFKWGKKNTSSWDWKSVKFSDVELGEIVSLLKGATTEVKFFHSFNEEKTQIWMRRIEDAVVCKAGTYTKGLSSGEQEVLRVLLEHTIWMMNIT